MKNVDFAIKQSAQLSVGSTCTISGDTLGGMARMGLAAAAAVASLAFALSAVAARVAKVNVMAPEEQVRFQFKNPGSRLKNVDCIMKNVEFITKTAEFIIKHQVAPCLPTWRPKIHAVNRIAEKGIHAVVCAGESYRTKASRNI